MMMGNFLIDFNLWEYPEKREEIVEGDCKWKNNGMENLRKQQLIYKFGS
jgi:hypothetical protein